MIYHTHALASVVALLLAGCGGAAFTVDNTRLGDAAEAGAPEEAATQEASAEAGAEASPAEEAGAPEAGPTDTGTVETDAPTAPDAPDAPVATCVTDLSNVGANDFKIAFTITTTFAGPTSMAVLNQRNATDCGQPPTAGPWWDVIVTSSGGVEASVSDGTHVAIVEAGDSVNDGKAHHVTVQRVHGSLFYTDDGAVRSALVTDNYPIIGFMPPFVTGSDPCTGTINTTGVVSDVCVSTP
jgi:hypothetical protein